MRVLMGAMAVCSLFGCGVDPDGSGVFGFSGSWQLTPRTRLVAEDCLVEFNDSQGRARCEGEQVIFESEDERLGEEITLEADLTITETVISGSGTWTRVDTYTFNGESESRRCTLTWSGTANRDAGRQSEGRFSALAGEWSGTARYSAECGGQQAGPDVDFRFTGDLFGDSAEIRWRELASEFEHLVGVQHRDGAGVSIDGIEVPEL